MTKHARDYHTHHSTRMIRVIVCVWCPLSQVPTAAVFDSVSPCSMLPASPFACAWFLIDPSSHRHIGIGSCLIICRYILHLERERLSRLVPRKHLHAQGLCVCCCLSPCGYSRSNTFPLSHFSHLGLCQFRLCCQWNCWPCKFAHDLVELKRAHTARLHLSFYFAICRYCRASMMSPGIICPVICH